MEPYFAVAYSKASKRSSCIVEFIA